MSKDMIDCVVVGLASLVRSSFNSFIKCFLTDMNRLCASTPTTSAYKSAMICMFAAFGPDCILR